MVKGRVRVVGRLLTLELTGARPGAPQPRTRWCVRVERTVTFEVVGGEISIYEPLRAAIAELQSETADVEAEVAVEVEEQ
jgi:hypothetical protein